MLRGVVLILLFFSAVASAALTKSAFHAMLHGMASQLFQKADINHDGEVSLQELQAAYDSYDANGNGKITEAEFVAAFGSRNKELSFLARGIFYAADKNNDNVLTNSDLKTFFNTIDKSGDGLLSETEFNNYFIELFEVILLAEMKKNGQSIVGVGR